MYKLLLRPILFLQEPEQAHHTFLSRAKKMQASRFCTGVMHKLFCLENRSLVQVIDGVRYNNPVGLAAGFDKNAEVGKFMQHLGFGHLELGSVTLHAHEGNSRPRLQRLIRDKSLVVNYGLCNDGAGVIGRRLSGLDLRIPFGVSIAKTPTAGGGEGIDDYAMSFSVLHSHGDYTTINVSCPNVADGQTYGENPLRLHELLERIGHCDPHKPVYLKLKPDYSFDQIDAILGVISQYAWVRGVIVSNLTKKREELLETPRINGGLSGNPVKNRSNELIAHIYQKTRGQITIIGCGGIMSARDAYDKIRAGASMVQLITGLIYEGPFLIRRINRGLVKFLTQDGYSSIREAIGAGHHAD